MEDVQKLYEDLKSNYFVEDENSKFSLKERLGIIIWLFKYLEYDFNEEQITYIICNKQRQITEACAGAGKTTMSILKIFCHIMFKDIEAERTVLISYTSKATKDIAFKVQQLRMNLNLIDLASKGLNDNFDVNVFSIHQYFQDILKEFPIEAGLKCVNGRFNIITDLEARGLISNIIDAMYEKQKMSTKPYQGLADKVHSLYTQIKEKDIMEKPEKWCERSAYREIEQVPITELKKIYRVYEKTKKSMLRMEFVDTPFICCEVFKNKYALDRWRKVFKTVFLDEYQDITESQIAVFKKIYSKEYNEAFFVMGDGDQSIYGFRGAHNNGCYNFDKDFSVDDKNQLQRCYFTENRRCGDVILSYARKIIETTNHRYYKELKSKRTGGVVKQISSPSYMEEAKKVYEYYCNIPDSEKEDTVIAYRSKSSARLVKKYFEDNYVKCIQDQPITDRFEEVLKDSLNLLKNPYDTYLMKKVLYKLLKSNRYLNRESLLSVIKKEEKRRSEGLVIKPFYDLDYSKINLPRGTELDIRMLKVLTKCIEGNNEEPKFKKIETMNRFVNYLVQNYIIPNYMLMLDRTIESDNGQHLFDERGKLQDEYGLSILEEYTKPITYNEFIIKRALRREKMEDRGQKINFSTFHSLKGLEYKNVIIIDLDDKIFPGYELTLATRFGGIVIENTDDEAKRLFYVAITRAKDNLLLSSNSNTPCRYLEYFKESETNEFGAMDKIEELFEEEISIDDLETEEDILELDVNGTPHHEETTLITSLERWLSK